MPQIRKGRKKDQDGAKIARSRKSRHPFKNGSPAQLRINKNEHKMLQHKCKVMARPAKEKNHVFTYIRSKKVGPLENKGERILLRKDREILQ